MIPEPCLQWPPPEATAPSSTREEAKAPSGGDSARRKRRWEALAEEEEEEEEVGLEVEPELARAMRRMRRTGSAGKPQPAGDPGTCIRAFGASAAGQAVLRRLVDQRAAAVASRPSSARRLAALGVAVGWAATAGLARGPGALTDQLEPALARLDRAVALAPADREVAAHRVRLARQSAALREQARQLSGAVVPAPAWEPVPVPRVDGSGLSAAEFRRKFSAPGLPVVLTGLVDRQMLNGAPRWSPEFVAAQAGQRRFAVRRLKPGSTQWAQLEKDALDTTVAEFVAKLPAGRAASPGGCLFDWSLPLFAPELAAQLAVPAVFDGDMLKLTPPGTLYRDSWPSLFVAPAGHTSELHVDTFGSHFWMAMMHGSKRWTFFPRDQTALLSPFFYGSTDPSFAAEIGSPDLEAQPLLAGCRPHSVVLGPGELLFVPAGWAHRVETLERSVAVSSNFVDQTNLDRALDELQVAGLTDPAAVVLGATLARLAGKDMD